MRAMRVRGPAVRVTRTAVTETDAVCVKRGRAFENGTDEGRKAVTNEARLVGCGVCYDGAMNAVFFYRPRGERS